MTTAPPRGDGIVARTFRDTPVTAWLIVVNLLFYVGTSVQALNPLDNARSSFFLHTALYPPAVAIDGEWWQLLTSAFEHFGPLHLLLNMYMLWVLGLGVEKSVGHLRYLGMYLVSAVAGSAAVMVYAQNVQTAGASGALFGVMGAYFVIAAAMRVEMRGIVTLIVLNVLVGVLVPGVSLTAHLGGLVGGALAALGMVVVPRRLPATVGTPTRELVSWVGAAVVLALALYVAWHGAQSLDVRGIHHP